MRRSQGSFTQKARKVLREVPDALILYASLQASDPEIIEISEIFSKNGEYSIAVPSEHGEITVDGKRYDIIESFTKSDAIERSAERPADLYKGWESLYQAALVTIDRLTKECDRLRENSSRDQDERLELKARIHQLETDPDDDSEMIAELMEVGKEIAAITAGKASEASEKFKTLFPRVLMRLSDDARQEVFSALREEGVSVPE